MPRKLTVTGALDLDLVRRVVRHNLADLELCYGDHLKSHPDDRAELLARFNILANGSVSDITLNPRTSGALGACVTDRIAKWIFPRSKDGQPVTVSYSFHFGG